MSITKTIRNMDVVIYITSDGMTWDLESRAKDHERYIQDSRINQSLHSMTLSFPLFDEILDATWYLMSNKEQIEYFTRVNTQPNNYKYVNHNSNAKISLGDWVTVEYELSSYDEVRTKAGVVTLAYVVEQMKKYIESTEEITVSGKY